MLRNNGILSLLAFVSQFAHAFKTALKTHFYKQSDFNSSFFCPSPLPLKFNVPSNYDETVL